MLVAFTLVFFLGICIGSFLLVLISRLPKGENILNDRSRCTYCHHSLSPMDLIPVVSFVFLRGKCRYCHKFYGWQYISIELLTGFLFVLTSWYVVFVLGAAFVSFITAIYLIILSSLIVIFFTDLWSGIIPDSAIVSLLLSGICLQLIHGTLGSAVIAGILASTFFLLLFTITKGRGMGLGDVKYVGAMGILLGTTGTLIGLYIAFLTGGFASTILLLAKKKKLIGSTIAFGPFLVIGTIIALIWGEALWRWYLGFL